MDCTRLDQLNLLHNWVYPSGEQLQSPWSALANNNRDLEEVVHGSIHTASTLTGGQALEESGPWGLKLFKIAIIVGIGISA